MAESSRSRVTITLGRTGQVVTRAGPVFDSGFPESQSAAGSKRSVRDRLGSGGEVYPLNNKRRREDNDRKAANDSPLEKSDLRFKLLRKNVIKQVQSNPQQNGMDLRQTLSRAVHYKSDHSMRQRIPEPLDLRPVQEYKSDHNMRRRIPEPLNSRPVQEYKSDHSMRQQIPEPLDSRPVQEYKSDHSMRQRIPEPLDSRPVQEYTSDHSMRQRIPEPMDSRPVLPQRRNDPSTMHIHPTRRANVLPMEPLKNQQSPWTLERLTENSPDRVLTTSRTLSSLRSDEEVIKRPLTRSYEDVRAVSYTGRDISEPRRPFGTTSYMSKPTMAVPPAKPGVPQISRPPPTSGAEQKSSYRVDERLSVDSFLYSLGLEKYIIPFKAEEVDMATLRQMGEHDLKELGIPMGPRKKILLALLPRSKVQLR